MTRVPSRPSQFLALLLCTNALDAQSPSTPQPPRTTTTQQELIVHHASWSHHLYSQVAIATKALQRSVDAMLRQPSDASLANAKAAWTTARKLYGQTEALRFHDGPIETLEPLINAWPVDEAYIDYVESRPNCGIVNDAKNYPALQAAVLQLANERGGEANICVGWHAIEFLLWGQDLSTTGPGNRSFTDFDPTKNKSATRRAAFLRSITELLASHMNELRDAWAPGSKYRTKFEADGALSIRRILTGATTLTAFELGGERLVVAYETRDQEQEHSCFSDTTTNDLLANQLGLRNILVGCAFAGKQGLGVVHLLGEQQQELRAELLTRLDATDKALQQIPQPFDQALLGDDQQPGRIALLRAIEALEQQTEILLIVGKHLGHDLPLTPGGDLR